MILAVNMAEPENEVRDFLATKVKVDFPILMDRDGAGAQGVEGVRVPDELCRWAGRNDSLWLYGEFEWDTEEVIRILEAMMPR